MLCGEDEQVAVIEMDEEHLWNPHKYTWKELRQLVSVYSSALRRAGLVKGEVVTCEYTPIHVNLDLH